MHRRRRVHEGGPDGPGLSPSMGCRAVGADGERLTAALGPGIRAGGRTPLSAPPVLGVASGHHREHETGARLAAVSEQPKVAQQALVGLARLPACPFARESKLAPKYG